MNNQVMYDTSEVKAWLVKELLNMVGYWLGRFFTEYPAAPEEVVAEAFDELLAMRRQSIKALREYALLTEIYVTQCAKDPETGCYSRFPELDVVYLKRKKGLDHGIDEAAKAMYGDGDPWEGINSD